MAQPPKYLSLDSSRFLPRFVGGYAFAVVGNLEPHEFLPENVSPGEAGKYVLAFFDHIKAQMSEHERADFISWRSRIHVSQSGDAFDFVCFSRPLTKGGDRYETILLVTNGNAGSAQACVGKCSCYMATGRIIPTPNYIAGQLSGARGGLIEPRFIGFPYCAFRDERANVKYLPQLEALLRQEGGGVAFFRETQNCMPPAEREQFVGWAKTAETPEGKERFQLGLLSMADEQGVLDVSLCLMLALGDAAEFEACADQAEAHIAESQRSAAEK